MAEFTKLTKATGHVVYVNPETIVQVRVNPNSTAGACLTTTGEGISLDTPREVQQIVEAVTCADPVRKRLLRLIDELEAEQRDGWNERCIQNVPGLLHAIAYIRKVVNAL